MEIRPIHTQADYKATLKEISVLMDPPDLWVRRRVIAWTSWPRWYRPMRPSTSHHGA